MNEIWKDVPGYENYMISNLGNVKSLNYNHTDREHLLSPGNCNGYLRVNLCKNGVKKYFLVHRLVYSTFVGEIPEGCEINHINENKTDNRLCNIEAISHKANINWGTGIARSAAAQKNHPQKSKVVEAIDKVTGRVVFTFPSTQEAGRNGFSSRNVAACCRGEVKTHKGFIWRYA